MIFNLFGSKSKVGVDIGTSSIKIVELSKKGGRFNLENYGIFEFKGSSTDVSLSQSLLKLPDEEIIWGIKELIKKSGIRSRNTIASISSFSTFSTVIQMPYLSEQDLAKAIPFEARKYVPIPLNEVVLDWSIIGIVDNNSGSVTDKPFVASGGKPTNVEIFLAAVPKDDTSRYQHIMSGAGLNLVALELENSGLIRGLLGNDLSTTAIVNIGGRSTSIIIVNKGYERLSHNYEIGGFEITKAISRSLNVSLEEAEKLKRSVGLSESSGNNIKDSMISLVDMMIFETKKTISSYEESRKQKVGRVLVMGGLANMPNFVNYFKQRIGRDVFLANAFSRIVYPSQLNPITQELSNNLSIAAGLAMRDI